MFNVTAEVQLLRIELEQFAGLVQNSAAKDSRDPRHATSLGCTRVSTPHNTHASVFGTTHEQLGDSQTMDSAASQGATIG